MQNREFFGIEIVTLPKGFKTLRGLERSADWAYWLSIGTMVAGSVATLAGCTIETLRGQRQADSPLLKLGLAAATLGTAAVVGADKWCQKVADISEAEDEGAIVCTEAQADKLTEPLQICLN